MIFLKFVFVKVHRRIFLKREWKKGEEIDTFGPRSGAKIELATQVRALDRGLEPVSFQCTGRRSNHWSRVKIS